jgi:hypothetical protein
VLRRRRLHHLLLRPAGELEGRGAAHLIIYHRHFALHCWNAWPGRGSSVY